jgi:hypothetical protein
LEKEESAKQLDIKILREKLYKQGVILEEPTKVALIGKDDWGKNF